MWEPMWTLSQALIGGVFFMALGCATCVHQLSYKGHQVSAVVSMGHAQSRPSPFTARQGHTMMRARFAMEWPIQASHSMAMARLTVSQPSTRTARRSAKQALSSLGRSLPSHLGKTMFSSHSELTVECLPAAPLALQAGGPKRCGPRACWSPGTQVSEALAAEGV